MTITRANVEAILVARCGKLLAAADLDGTTIAGTNASLNDPIGWAARQLGYPVANLTAVSDSDLANVTDDEVDQLLDLAELRTLQNIEGNLDDVDISANGRDESLGQLVKQVQTRLDRVKAAIEKTYGTGLGTLSAGVVTLDFMEKDE
jgi:hypothetical protein